MEDKPIKPRPILITPDHYEGLDEWYTHAFKCPKCQVTNVLDDEAKYCRGCGRPVKLTTGVLKLSERVM